MKKNIFITTVFLLTICMLNFSCKKNNDAKTTTVEYRVGANGGSSGIPIALPIAGILYYTADNTFVTVTDWSQFPNGAKSISITKKPFDASLQVNLFPLSQYPTGFNSLTLSILVDGQVKQSQDFPAQSLQGLVSVNVEYTVQ